MTLASAPSLANRRRPLAVRCCYIAGSMRVFWDHLPTKTRGRNALSDTGSRASGSRIFIQLPLGVRLAYQAARQLTVTTRLRFSVDRMGDGVRQLCYREGDVSSPLFVIRTRIRRRVECLRRGSDARVPRVAVGRNEEP